MSAFRYRAWDFLTMAPLDEVPYTGAVFNRRLMGGGGSFAANLAIGDPRISRKFDWQNATADGKALLFIDYFGTIIWGGLITSSNWAGGQAQQLPIGGTELNDFFNRRELPFDYSNTWASPTDLFVIAKQLINDTLGVDNPAGIQVASNVTATGVTITPQISGEQMLLGAIDGLAAGGLNAGFDYTIDAAYNAGVPRFTWNLWYPRAGRTVAQNSLTISRNQMLEEPAYSRDATKQARKVIETTSAADVQRATIDTNSPGYVLTEGIYSRGNVTNQTQLANAAIGDASLYGYPVATMQVKLPMPLTRADAADPSLLSPGMIVPGDNVLIRIDPRAGQGQNQSARFPDGLKWEARCVNITYYPEGTGSSKRPQWWLDLVQPPFGTFPATAPPA